MGAQRLILLSIDRLSIAPRISNDCLRYSLLSICFSLSFLGGFTYFQDCLSYARGLCYGNLKSPSIVPGAMWKCLQFWYYLERYGFTSLEVSLVSNETRTTLWSSNWKEQSRGYWSLVRVPMSARLTSFQVSYHNKYLSLMLLLQLQLMSSFFATLSISQCRLNWHILIRILCTFISFLINIVII